MRKTRVDQAEKLARVEKLVRHIQNTAIRLETVAVRLEFALEETRPVEAELDTFELDHHHMGSLTLHVDGDFEEFHKVLSAASVVISKAIAASETLSSRGVSLYCTPKTDDAS